MSAAHMPLLAVTIGEFLAGKVLDLAVLVLLLVVGGLFSGAETALFALSRGQLFHLSRDHRRLPRLAASLMQHPDSVLTTVLLGTNVVRILFFVLSTLMIVQIKSRVDHGQLWASVMAAGTLLAVIVFSEILPKTVCFVAAMQLAPLAAAPLAVLGRLVGPLRRWLMALLITPLTRLLAPRRTRRGGLEADEMAALLALSQKRGLIGQDETELLHEVLELTDLRAGDIMVPRVDMMACPAGAGADELLELMRRKGVTKVPVYEGDLDHIVGAVYAKRLLTAADAGPAELASPVQFVPESAPLERVLMQFRATRSQLAIVVDEYGGTAGLVTLEDIIEEVVGDIADAREPPREPPVRQVGQTEWLVHGDLPIHEWAQAFPADLAGARFSTVGGLVISLLGQDPSAGQSVSYRNVEFTVEQVRRHRITLLRVRLGGANSPGRAPGDAEGRP